jgi:autotransporter passenger strand-loop-strand repeat protein
LLSVLSGGEASFVQITSGGRLLVSSGGVASKTEVSSGGQETVFGVDSFDTVLSGGTLVISSGGETSGTKALRVVHCLDIPAGDLAGSAPV